MADKWQIPSYLKSPDFYSLLLEILIVQIKFYIYWVISIVKFFLPKEPVNVRGEVVLITGAGHGMGKEMALQYGQLGATVICWDINEKNNAQTVKEVKAGGGQAFAYICNVTDRNEINEIAAKVKKEHGFVAIVVNNAGIMPTHLLLDQTEQEIRTTYEVNVLAHFWILQAFLPDMIEKNQGHIVAMSSCAGLFGLRNLVPYCGTKFAVRGIMQSLSEELYENNPNSNIKLTTIYPYMVDTGLCKKPRYRFEFMRMVNPKDAATAIIKAQRLGIEEVTIPGHYLYMEKIGRLLPKSAMRVVSNFLDSGVNSDL